MEIRKQGVSIEEPGEINMADFLSKSGHEALKIKGFECDCFLQLAIEKTLSFEAYEEANFFEDLQSTKFEAIITFDTLYLDCNTNNFPGGKNCHLSFHRTLFTLQDLLLKYFKKGLEILHVKLNFLFTPWPCFKQRKSPPKALKKSTNRSVTSSIIRTCFGLVSTTIPAVINLEIHAIKSAAVVVVIRA